MVARGVYSADLQGKETFAKKAESPRHMASSVKFMAGHLTLMTMSDVDETVTVVESDIVRGSSAQLRAGDVVTVHDLLLGLMLASGNDAAACLSRVVGSRLLEQEGRDGDPRERFVAEMNALAQEWHLGSVTFGSPAGNERRSVATPRELVEMTRRMWLVDSPIFGYAGTMAHTARIADPNARDIDLVSTTVADTIVRFPELIAVKTGALGPVGNLILVWRHPRTNEPNFSVIMASRPRPQRFIDMRRLVNDLSGITPAPLTINGVGVRAMKVGAAQVRAIRLGTESGQLTVWESPSASKW